MSGRLVGEFIHFSGFSDLLRSAKQSPSSMTVEMRVTFDNGMDAQSLIWQLQEALSALKAAARQKKGRRGVKMTDGREGEA